jgi:choline dehydrogenase-like flavoprotein
MPKEPEFTSFSRDVLGRFICSTWEEATPDSEGIDVVVLGSGMYGGYCASKIYELSRQRFGKEEGKDEFDTDGSKALRVLVLEAGPFLIPEHGQNIPNLGLNDPFGNGRTLGQDGNGPINVGAGSQPGIRKLVWGVGWRSNQPFVGQAYCVGGKGIYWGGWCPRFQESDLKQWPQEVRDYLVTPDQSVGTRPIEHRDPFDDKKILNRGEPLSAYETLEYEIGVLPSDDFVFDPVQLAKSVTGTQKVGLNRALQFFLDQSRGTTDSRITQVLAAPIAVQTQSFISGLFALDKYSSLPTLTGSIRADHGDGRDSDLRIAVVPFTHVVRLDCEPDSESPNIGTRVVRKIVVKNNDEFKELTIAPHCQVVLAMSCIESTRLALESFSLVGSGLAPAGQELLGRNFMIHLRADIGFAVERTNLENFVKDTWPKHELADLLQLASLHIQCEGSNGRYQYQLFAATNADGPDDNMYKMIPDLNVQKQIAQEFDADKIRLVLRASGEVQGGRDFPIGNPGFDYIDLAGNVDFDQTFNHRRAWVQFNRGDHFSNPIWQDIFDTGHAIARTLANGGTLDYIPERLNDNDRKQGVGTTFHDSGTLWMGDDPQKSVTDVNGHFHHVTNAYCSDQALFTTVGSANPVLTGLALTRKVAANIVDRHDSYDGDKDTLSGFPVSLAKSRGWLEVPYDGIIRLSDEIIETNPIGNIGFSYLPETFDNFELIIDWKAFRTYRSQPLIPNAGILLRMPDPTGVDFSNQTAFDNFYDRVTEIQIDETGKNFVRSRFPQAIFGDSLFKTGAIYGLAPATQWAAKALAPDGNDTANRYWNTFHVTAQDNKVTVRLNGKQVSEGIIPTPLKPLSGFIGLQFHTGRVQFRNLRIKPLP